MKLTRREFSAMAGALGAALAYPSSTAAKARWSENRNAYPQGVGSGDPDANSVILWTRRAPEPIFLAVSVPQAIAFAL